MGSRTERLHIRATSAALLAAFLAAATLASLNVVCAAEGDDLINQGMTQNQAGNYPAAINAFERYIQLYPNGASINQAHLYAGHAHMLQNKYITNAEASAAQNHFNEILKQGDNARFFKEALFHTAHLAYEMRNYSDAKTRFEDFLKRYPNDGYNVYVYYYLANCEKQLGDNRSAITHYEQALSKDPTSALNWNCRLERASLIGKMGDYNFAERELAALASTANLPADIAGQVAVQRALLQIVQQRYDNAIEILERYVSQYKTYDDSVATDTMATVYLHEAYAYCAKRDFQTALSVIESNLERNKNTLIPEAALLKIKLLLALGRKTDAAALLNSFASSAYGRENPDLVTSYQGMVDLMNGEYDKTIASLTKMLGVHQTTRSSSSYGTNYAPNSDLGPDYSAGTHSSSYNGSLTMAVDYFGKTGGQNLEPIECVEACGTLILAYASRYAAKGVALDADYQDAIYQETLNYANWLNDPIVNLVVKGIDTRRKNALTKPVATAAESFYVVTPYATNEYSSTPGQFADPTSSGGYQRPNYYMDGSVANTYRPRDYYASDAYRWGNQQERRYDAANPNANGTTNSSSQYNAVPNGQNTRNADPRYSNGATNNANGALAPNNAGNANGAPNLNNNANNATGQNNAAGTANAGNQAQGAVQYGPDGRPIDPNAAAGNANAQNADGAQPADTADRRITPTEAKDTLDKAENFYYNQEFERCNETLLELLTSSETFWQDCPGVAPQVSLLRGDALTQLGKRSEAQMSYQDVVDNSPYSPQAPIAAANIGFNYDDLGRTQEATEYLRRATAGGVVTPLTDKALYLLGMNEKERGNIQGAKQAFARVYRDFSSSPYWSHATWALAALESASGADVEAEKLVNEALKSGPDVMIIDYLLFLKGEIALRAKDYTKALIAFDMIVEQYPDSSLYSRAINRLAAIPEKYRNDFNFEEVFEEEAPARPQTPTRAPQTTSRPSALETNGQTATPPGRPGDDRTELPPRRSLDELRRSAQESSARTSTQTSTSRTTATGAPNPSSTKATTTTPATGSSTNSGSTSNKSTGTTTSSSTKK
ncbi:MAG: tetratricopeptide repeat protein [Thermoguttaceae bacterium]|nr:tetratricopeptide repeat protein [Thermoguttaceae bacterium]